MGGLFSLVLDLRSKNTSNELELEFESFALGDGIRHNVHKLFSSSSPI